MVFITTPCLVVLQYFGAERPIFTSFDRNPRNFGISLCILTFALPILTFVFSLVCDMYDYVILRMNSKMTHKSEVPEGVF
jgi:hypothetical protein